MNWKDINMEQFVQLQKAMQRKYRRPEQKTFALANIVFGKDIQQEPVADLRRYYAELEELLNAPLEDADVHKCYTLNGHMYHLNYKIEQMTTAQYIDFTNLTKEADRNLVAILAVFIIPEGHKYNDGDYDIDEVREDIAKHMNAVEGNAIIFFIIGRSKTYMQRLVFCSLGQMMMVKTMTIKQRWNLSKALYQGWRSLERSIMQ